MMMRKIPIGTDNFTKLREEEFYYVDKTLLIKELLENWAEVNLFTRPRRFGKSLNMSMLQAFFDIKSNPAVFNGLNIVEQEKELCNQHMNKYPVISITLKDVEGDSYAAVFRSISNAIGFKAREFPELIDSDKLLEEEKKAYKQLIANADVGDISTFDLKDGVLKSSLLTLSNLLYKHYERKVILLIDEYDVPLDKANGKDYYNKVVELIRSILSRALKSNENLQFAVLTGCLRVGKESIFTGLNNLHIMSIQDMMYDEFFGFTKDEVKDLLQYYGLQDRIQQVEDWYDGYLFGKQKVFCPWDVLKYVFDVRAGWKGMPKCYWANSSGNNIVRKLLEQSTPNVKAEIEELVEYGTIRKVLNNTLTYQEIYDSPDNIWSVLFATGYLTMTEPPKDEYTDLKIPNLEVRTIFVNQIMDWIKEQSNQKEVNALCKMILEGETQKIKEFFNDFLKRTISIRDTFVPKVKKENFYHGVLLGLLGKSDYIRTESNVEAGNGYSDIAIFDTINSRGALIEVKYAENGDLQSACKKGLKQIEEKNYMELFRKAGIKNVNQYAISCYLKECDIMGKIYS